jgi:DNA-binding CsgD family transcriptional regulator
MVVAGSETLVGRDDELDRLESFVAETRDGPQKLVFEGEAGIGKTRLWRAGVERARELGCRVLEARPAAAECELSYAGLGDLLAGMHDEIGGLPAPQRRALRIALVLEEAKGEPPDKRAIAAAVLELLRRLSADAPLVVALDDIQWLDPPSAGALQFALRRLEEEPVGVLVTSRVRTGLTIIGFDDAERISVGPLSLDALDRLVRTRLGARFLRPTLRRLEEASGGNPFYALEIAASLLRSGGRLESGEPLPIPAVLRELVRDRLATLRPAAREAALAASALAQPTVSTIHEVIGEGSAAVSEAVALGVLDSDGERLRFSHPLFASTLYEDSPLEARRDVHKRLAKIVGEPEERARHLAEAADGPDEEVASALEAAAASVAARGAPDAAARLARQAFELTPPNNRAEAHRRCLAWARFSVAAGDPHLAETLLERQLQLVEPGRERAETEFELGKALLATRGISAARAWYERALLELEGTDDLRLQAMILVELADMHIGEVEMDSDASARAVALAERLGEPDLLARALGRHGRMLMLVGQPPPEEYWRRALEIEQAAGDLRIGGPTQTYSDVLFYRGDLRRSAELGLRVLASMRRRGDPMLPNALLAASEGARVSGDWDAAARYAEEAHDLAVQTGRESLEPECVLWKARVAHPRGDLELARRQAEEAIALSERVALSGVDRAWTEGLARAVLGQIAAVSGRHAEAHEWITAAFEAVQQFEKLLQHFVAELLAGDIESLVALGALEEAAKHLERLVELTTPLAIPTLDVVVARTRGLVAAAEGDTAGALHHLEHAVALYETLQAPWPFQHAITLLMLGGVQRRARQKLAARQTLERALEIFEGLGARLWAEKTRAELRQISGRPSRAGALTATEQSVAELVAAGRSNAEVAHELFISPKTVEWNLSKIYKKLHVRSRAELAAKLARQTAGLQS